LAEIFGIVWVIMPEEYESPYQEPPDDPDNWQDYADEPEK
jgi:hypothetical protein